MKGFPDFIYTDGTIQQLKNAGGLRLIRKLKAVDSIMAYDAVVKSTLINEKMLTDNLIELDKMANHTFDYLLLDEHFAGGKSVDQVPNFILGPKEYIIFYNDAKHYRWMMTILRRNMMDVKDHATRLMGFLQKEYHVSEYD